MLRWLTRTFPSRLWEAAQKWQADDGPTWAASLGYFAAFSFFPLILVMLAGAGFVLKYSAKAQLQQKQLIDMIGQQWSTKLAEQLNSILNGVENHAPISGPIGLVILVYSAIGIFTQLDAAFDRIWKNQSDPNRRGGWVGMVLNVLFVRLRAFLMLLGLGGIVVLTFIASLVISAVARHAEEVPLGHTLFHWVNVAIGAGLNMLFFTLVYRLVPRYPVQWRHALGGAIVAGFAWEVGRQLLGMFLVGGSYTAYGVIGSFILMMLWFNYASMVLLYGAEFVEISSRAGK